MAVRMELSRILIRENSPSQRIELKEVDGQRVVPIVIGIMEAAAIERRLLGQTPPRPQTHELLESVVSALGASLEQIVINDLRQDQFGDGTFYARLVLRQGDQMVDVDARPSDAIALGCARNVPIFVEEHVLDLLAVEPPAGGPPLGFGIGGDDDSAFEPGDLDFEDDADGHEDDDEDGDEDGEDGFEDDDADDDAEDPEDEYEDEDGHEGPHTR